MHCDGLTPPIDRFATSQHIYVAILNERLQLVNLTSEMLRNNNKSCGMADSNGKYSTQRLSSDVLF